MATARADEPAAAPAAAAAAAPPPPLKVLLIGQAAFGAAVFAKLSSADVPTAQIVGVAAPAAEDPLWLAAQQAAVPLLLRTRALCPPPTDAADTAAAAAAAATATAWGAACDAADLCVMAFVTELIPAEFLQRPRLGALQFHPSLLPKHRGMSALNWAIIDGDAETGLSIFWVDRYLDHGPLLLQDTLAIAPDDTVKSLYFERVFPRGVDALARAVALVHAGAAPRFPQAHAAATYDPPCDDAVAQIRWNLAAPRLGALVRGCNPQPGAYSGFRGEKIRFFDCALRAELAIGWPGTVLSVSEDRFAVRLNGGVLDVLRVQAPGSPKVAAGVWAKAVGLKKGDRFRPLP